MRFANTNQAIAMQKNCMYTLPFTTKDIDETISTLHAQEKHFNHEYTCILVINDINKQLMNININ